MIILVTAGNFVQMFIGWEGVGLCSYLLINFWHTRIQANKAAIKAVIMNRVGDFGLVLAILAIFFVFKTVDYSVLFSLIPYYVDSNLVGNVSLFFFDFNVLTFICICIFIGVAGKSAQLGLHTWLPDAMEGPTPVSALIHAATMVTAGVYMVVRIFPILTPDALEVIAYVGGITALMAAIIAITQNDIKRVLAYSTVSQLGYMIMALGVGAYQAGFFHLTTHAMFKACLFLCSGSVIHVEHGALHELPNRCIRKDML
jgi:NADH:ubiquinone oxidoreductase subunit 5 (subunit L)/multisubunit Na+/H+ antiporter MnhA subunit